MHRYSNKIRSPSIVAFRGTPEDEAVLHRVFKHTAPTVWLSEPSPTCAQTLMELDPDALVIMDSCYEAAVSLAAVLDLRRRTLFYVSGEEATVALLHISDSGTVFQEALTPLEVRRILLH